MNLLDSVTKYNQEAFEVYTSTENPYDVGYVISDNYLHQAVVYSEAGKIKEAEQCFETGKKLMNPKKIDANVSLSYVSGVIAYYQADYELVSIPYWPKCTKNRNFIIKLWRLPAIH